MTRSRTLRVSALGLALFAIGLKTGPTEAQEQSAIIDDTIHRYVNLDQRVAGGPGGGSGVDGDDVSEYPASATVEFSDFSLNGIPLDDWAACRGDPNFGTVQTCLEDLIGDGNLNTEEELHPGEIGGDIFEFDLTITNTSTDAVLTAFGFQSKFSESPALGSRIGDKLFTAVRTALEGPFPPSDPDQLLVGVKKNGTSNGLFDGKRKFICVNSSTDYPSNLNAGTENETLECAGGRTFDPDTSGPVLVDGDGDEIDSADGRLPKGLLPGASMTIRLQLDSGTDDGALHRAHQATGPPSGDTGPLTGELDLSGSCPTLEEGSGNIVEIVDFGDVKIPETPTATAHLPSSPSRTTSSSPSPAGTGVSPTSWTLATPGRMTLRIRSLTTLRSSRPSTTRPTACSRCSTSATWSPATSTSRPWSRDSASMGRGSTRPASRRARSPAPAAGCRTCRSASSMPTPPTASWSARRSPAPTAATATARRSRRTSIRRPPPA